MTKRKSPKLGVLDLEAVRGGEDPKKTPPQEQYYKIKLVEIIVTSAGN